MNKEKVKQITGDYLYDEDGNVIEDVSEDEIKAIMMLRKMNN